MTWLQVGPKVFEDLPIRYFRMGQKTRRYLAKHILDYLDAEGQWQRKAHLVVGLLTVPCTTDTLAAFLLLKGAES